MVVEWVELLRLRNRLVLPRGSLIDFMLIGWMSVSCMTGGSSFGFGLYLMKPPESNMQ